MSLPPSILGLAQNDILSTSDDGSRTSGSTGDSSVHAVVYAGYGGEEAGTGLADVIAGAYNPAGRLPVTFYRSVKQVLCVCTE